LQGLDQFPDLVEKAKAVMGISARRAFSKHVLWVEISGPKMPKLTLVDARWFVWACWWTDLIMLIRD